MKEITSYIQEKMDESEFYEILGWGIFKAFITTCLIFIAVIYILTPVTGVAAGSTFFVAFLITYASFIYVFKLKTWESYGKWGIGTAFYTFVMYLLGESIFISILFMGLLLTLMFLISQGIFSGIYTRGGLIKWVKEDQEEVEREKKIKELSEPINYDPTRA